MYKWNQEKNKKLYETRGVTFEEVVQAISDGLAVADVPHWNQKKYPGQRIITVMLGNYAHLIPYVKDGDTYFLKTIIPSRKENRRVKRKKP